MAGTTEEVDIVDEDEDEVDDDQSAPFQSDQIVQDSEPDSFLNIASPDYSNNVDLNKLLAEMRA